jgi:Flp pilus assembly protein TadD
MMNSRLLRCSIFGILFLAPSAILAQAPEKAGMGVVDFDVKGALEEKDAGVIVAEIFIGRIDSKKYRLYERTQLNRLLRERALQATDLVADPEKAIQFGKAARIRYLLIGTVSKLGGNIILGARTIDCETGEIGERATISGASMDQLPDMVDRCLAVMGLSRVVRKPAPGYIGVRIGDINDAMAKTLGFTNARDMSEKLGLGGRTDGAYVVEVPAGGPASKAGLRPADVIMEYDGNPVANALDLKTRSGAAEAGSEVSLKVIRDGKPLALSLTIGERPPELLLLDRALTLSLSGDVDGAVAAYRELVRLTPQDAEAHLALGGELLRKKDWDGALAALREAVRLKPDYAFAHAELGVVLVNKNDLNGGIAEYREALRLNPDDAWTHGNLGAALWNKGDVEASFLEYKEAARLTPSDPIPHYNLALYYARQKDKRMAVESLRKAVELNPAFKETAASDKGFESLKGDKEFKRLIGK